MILRAMVQGILIVVGVALETYKQLEGSLATRNYKTLSCVLL